MYYVSKRLEVAGAHQLKLDYESPCTNLHGHNWIITVECKSKTLNKNGMIVDFKAIKEAVSNKFDHQYLNEVVKFNPTAENIAKYICDCIPNCFRVSVQESEGNIAVYEKEDN